MSNPTADEQLKLAKYLARELFKVGDETRDKVHRIAFRGGRYEPGNPKAETDLGGLCEVALVDVIEAALQRRQK